MVAKPDRSGSCWEEVLRLLPRNLREIVSQLPDGILDRLEEVRLRVHRPLILSLNDGDIFVDSRGRPVEIPEEAYVVSTDDLERFTHIISNSSLYALEEELKNGFITLPGGHRVGIVGKAVVEGGKVRTIKPIAGFNVRITREIPGVATGLLPHLIDREHEQVYHTLIFSPPRCGKTTILRDLVRQLSDGVPEIGWRGVTVGLVDERSELAGCYRGVPQRDVGVRTDVLDGCPKAEGMMMLLRAMAPDVVATDEIGRREDVIALEEVFNAGVKVLVTAHGASIKDLTLRPALKYLVELGIIERYVLLGRSRGVGTVEDIFDGRTMRSLLEVRGC